MAMKIGSKYRFDELQARHWQRFASQAWLSESQTLKRLAHIAKRLPAEAAKLQNNKRAGYAKLPVVEQIVAGIEKHCELTVKRLSD